MIIHRTKQNYYSSNLNNKLDLNKHQNYRDLTKPMGLLKTGLNRTITEDATYIFRNYFSFPFVIFYYLMRSNPLYFLRYQGWSFGPADRMFNSIEDCFKMTYINKNALNDNKELIPEFYNVDILPNMLTNVFNINFLWIGDVIMKKKKEPTKNDYMGCYLYLEEAFLTNFNNKDKILRKENKW